MGGGHEPDVVLRALEEARPHIVLLDLDLEGAADGILERAAQIDDGPRILAISAEVSLDVQLQAARQGAHGFLAKSLGPTELLRALRTVARGEKWFTRQVADRMIDEYRLLARRIKEEERSENPLSDRERDVLVCVAEGLTNKEIAARLHMSVHTVKLHIQKLFRKLDLPNRTEAAVYAVRKGIVRPDDDIGFSPRK